MEPRCNFDTISQFLSFPNLWRNPENWKNWLKKIIILHFSWWKKKKNENIWIHFSVFPNFHLCLENWTDKCYTESGCLHQWLAHRTLTLELWNLILPGPSLCTLPRMHNNKNVLSSCFWTGEKCLWFCQKSVFKQLSIWCRQ